LPDLLQRDRFAAQAFRRRFNLRALAERQRLAFLVLQRLEVAEVGEVRRNDDRSARPM
jgi:hypothetical protein